MYEIGEAKQLKWCTKGRWPWTGPWSTTFTCPFTSRRCQIVDTVASKYVNLWRKHGIHHHHHHHWLYSPSGPWPPLIRFRNHSLRRAVGLPGRVISSSQGLYLHRTTQHRKTMDKHPCPMQDSNTRSSVRKLKAHISDGAATGSAETRYCMRKKEVKQDNVC
jgi:hypothetical protein